MDRLTNNLQQYGSSWRQHAAITVTDATRTVKHRNSRTATKKRTCIAPGHVHRARTATQRPAAAAAAVAQAAPYRKQHPTWGTRRHSQKHRTQVCVRATCETVAGVNCGHFTSAVSNDSMRRLSGSTASSPCATVDRQTDTRKGQRVSTLPTKLIISGMAIRKKHKHTCSAGTVVHRPQTCVAYHQRRYQQRPQ